MRTILITGGDRGLGKALVTLYSKSQDHVIFTYHHNLTAAQNLKAEISNLYHNSVDFFELDLSNEESIKSLVQSLPKIDILINNAAIYKDNNIYQKDFKEFNQILTTNLTGPYYLTSLLVKDHFNYPGNIIFVSSNNAFGSNYPESIDYDASKAGINMLVYDFAQFLFPNIRVNGIAPGWINTEDNQHFDSDFMSQENSKILLQRFAEPEEIANIIYFITSPSGSYINKTIIKADGGTYGN